MSEAEISNGTLTAQFRPRLGGRLSRLSHSKLGDLIVPMNGEAFDPWQWPKAGAFPLFPYHGALYGPQFEFQGRLIGALANPTLTVPMALHGPSQRRPWRVSDRRDAELTMELTYQADAEWPFPFVATQRFTLVEDGIVVGLGLTNVGDRVMPAGMGWHPYFRVGADTAISCDARFSWPRESRTAPSEPRRVDRDPTSPLVVSPSPYFMSGWSEVRADLGGGAAMQLKATGALAHVIVLRTELYSCIEPVSHVAGALHYLDDPQTGVALLAPGKMLSAEVSIRLHD